MLWFEDDHQPEFGFFDRSAARISSMARGMCTKNLLRRFTGGAFVEDLLNGDPRAKGDRFAPHD